MNNAGDVLFLDSTHPSLAEALTKIGYRCFFKPDISVEGLIQMMPGLSGIIVRSRFKIDKNILQHAVRLRFIGRVGSGLENIDVAYAESRGIVCLNSPEGNRQAVGEHAAGMLLALVNKICVADGEVRKGLWKREQNRGIELSGKTLGIIGYGNTGSAFAQCISGFGMKVLAYDKYKSGFGSHLAKEADMEEIFRCADVLSLHIPLNEETRYLADAKYFSKFKKRIYLINTSRGEVVNTEGLLAALESRQILGAALDVLEYEHLSFEHLDTDSLPGSFRRLAELPNVVLTPHVAGWTNESQVKLSTVLAKKISDLPTH